MGPVGPAGPGGDGEPESKTFGFLTVPGFVGSSTDARYRNTFDTSDFALGFSNLRCIAGGGAGRVDRQDLMISLVDSPGIVKLLDATNTGLHLPTVTLEVCNGSSDRGPICLLTIVLTEASVTSVSYSCALCNGVPT